MKLNLTVSALAAVLGLALATSATAQTPAPATTPAAAPAAKTTKSAKAKKTEYSGNITAIDATSVTVTTSKKTLVLAIAPTTKYKNGDKKGATVADFAVGDKVTGSYTADATGALTAASLHKGAPKKVAKAKTPATTAPAATPAAQ